MITLLNSLKATFTNIGTFGIVNQLQNGQLYIDGANGEKKEFNINDSLGDVVYLRDLQQSTFEKLTDVNCGGAVYSEAKSMKLVFYSFKMDYELYCKYVREILLLLANNPNVRLNSKSSDFEDVYQKEQGKSFDSGIIPYITEIRFTLECDI